MEGIVDEVNKTFPPSKKISKVDIIDKRMPTSSTLKIKRFEVAKELDNE